MCESSSMKRKFNHMNPSAEDTIWSVWIRFRRVR
jgi:hypothetical protein